MKRVIAWFLIAIVIVGGLLIIWRTIEGYFMVSVRDDIVYDGLGRRVTESPFWFKMIFRQESWPGIKNTIWDMIIFWVSAGILYAIGSVAKNLNESK